MPDYDLGTARGHIEIDSSGVEYGIAKAQKATKDFDKDLDKLGAGMTKVGGIMTAAGAVVAAGFAVAIKSAADFEQKINGVAAVSTATQDQLDGIREKALQLGADTVFSASEAAGAIEELAKAGIPLEDIMNGAADATVSLAAAGGVDLAQAATIAANAMNAFGLEASDMTHVADVLAGAANASAADVGQLGEALQQVGAVANTVGMSFDDTVVALSALADAGIRGSDAGTSLKTFLVNLNPTTKEAAELMERLGIATYEGGVSSDEYADALKNLKPAQQKVIDAQRDLNDLLAEFKAQDIDETARVQEKKMQDVATATKRVADAQRDLQQLQDRLASGKAEDAATAQARALNEQKRAAQQLQDAEKSLADLRARQAASASQESADAAQRGAEAQQRATERLKAAEQDLADLRARQNASYATTTLESLTRQQQLRDALQKVADAQKGVAEASKAGTSSNTANDISRQQQLEEAVKKVTDARAALNDAGKVSATGGASSDISKQQQLEDAMKKVAEAQQGLNDARKEPEGVKLSETEKLRRQQALRDATEKQKDAQDDLNKTQKILAGGVGQLNNKFFDSQGHLKSLAEVSQILQDALKGQTDQQKLATLQTLFGTDAIRAASVIEKEGAKGIQELYGEMQKTTAADTAAARMKGLKGDLENLKGSAETAAIQMGQIFQPMMGGIAQALTGVTNFIGNLSPGMKTFAGILGGVTAGFAGLFGSALLVGGTLVKAKKTYDDVRDAIKGLEIAKKVSGAVEALNTSFLANPIVLIISGLVLLGIALFVLYKKFKPFREFVDGMWQSIQDAWDKIMPIFEAIGDGFKKLFDFIKPIIGIFVDYWLNTFGNIFQVIKGIFDIFAGLFTGDWGRMWDGVKEVFGGIWDQIKNVFGTVLALITSKLGGFILDILAKFGKFLLDLVVGAAKGLWDLLGEFGKFMTTLPEKFLWLIGFLLGLYVRLWSELIQLAIEWVPKIVGKIIELLLGLPGKMWELFTKAIEMIVNFGKSALSWAADVGTKILNGVIDIIKNLPGNAVKFFNEMKDKIIGLAGTIATAAKSIGTTIIDNIFDFVKHIPEHLKDVVDAIIQLLKDAGPKLGGAALDMGKGLVKGFLKGIGKESPSDFEENMDEVLTNVAKQVRVLQGHTETIQRLGATLPGAVPSVAYSASVAGLSASQAAVASGATGGSSAPIVAGGDTYNFHEVKADSMEIAQDISWTKRLRVRS